MKISNYRILTLLAPCKHSQRIPVLLFGGPSHLISLKLAQRDAKGPRKTRRWNGKVVIQPASPTHLPDVSAAI